MYCVFYTKGLRRKSKACPTRVFYGEQIDDLAPYTSAENSRVPALRAAKYLV